mmetsp:Transcript_60577/g.172225  ORF Transcript_60577/g.172225 Transcript_60577/m.172225 type:complete len:446 (+) Transcript_60577:231-1568(+)
MLRACQGRRADRQGSLWDVAHSEPDQDDDQRHRAGHGLGICGDAGLAPGDGGRRPRGGLPAGLAGAAGPVCGVRRARRRAGVEDRRGEVPRRARGVCTGLLRGGRGRGRSSGGRRQAQGEGCEGRGGPPVGDRRQVFAPGHVEDGRGAAEAGRQRERRREAPAGSRGRAAGAAREAQRLQPHRQHGDRRAGRLQRGRRAAEEADGGELRRLPRRTLPERRGGGAVAGPQARAARRGGAHQGRRRARGARRRVPPHRRVGPEPLPRTGGFPLQVQGGPAAREAEGVVRARGPVPGAHRGGRVPAAGVRRHLRAAQLPGGRGRGAGSAAGGRLRGRGRGAAGGQELQPRPDGHQGQGRGQLQRHRRQATMIRSPDWQTPVMRGRALFSHSGCHRSASSHIVALVTLDLFNTAVKFSAACASPSCLPRPYLQPLRYQNSSLGLMRTRR